MLDVGVGAYFHFGRLCILDGASLLRYTSARKGGIVSDMSLGRRQRLRTPKPHYIHT
jgi:hypothetical protein